MKRNLLPHEIEERAAEARSFINSPLVEEIFNDLQQEYLDRLIQAEVGDLTAAAAHASMKVLADVRNKLQSYVNDQLMLRKKGK